MTDTDTGFSAKSPDHFLSPVQTARAWRVAMWAGLFGVTYGVFCLQDVPRTRFLTELKATPRDFGWISGLGSFAIVFQLIAGIWANKLRRRKAIWMTVAVIHRLAFIGALAAPALLLGERARIWWIIGFLFLHDSLANLGSPLWMAWMGDIVPSDSVNRMWGERQRTLNAVVVVGMLAVAFLMGHFEKQNQVIFGFILLAAAGVAAGVVEVLMYAAIPDPPKEPDKEGNLFKAALEPLRDKQYRPFLYFLFYWSFSMLLCAYFFTPYMVEYLKMPVRTVQLITMTNVIGVVVASPLCAILCDTYGNRPVLQIALVAKVFALIAFVLAPPIPGIFTPWITVAFGFDGITNAGIMIAIQGIMFHASPRRNRAMYIATTNVLAVGVAGSIAPVIGGEVIQRLRNVYWDVGIYHFNGYHLIFAASAVLRAGAVYFAGRVPSRKMIPMRVVVAQMFKMREMTTVLWELGLLSWGLQQRRARAAQQLGDRRSPLAIGGLIDALQDKSRLVRHAAADALGRIGTSEASEPLARALFDSKLGVRPAVARALGSIGDFTSLQALLQNLRDLDPETLTQTIDSLGRIGDSAAILPLICLFDEIEEPQLRQKIGETLSLISRAHTPQEVMALFSRSRRP